MSEYEYEAGTDIDEEAEAVAAAFDAMIDGEESAALKQEADDAPKAAPENDDQQDYEFTVDDDPAVSPEESKARALGWAPEDEWRGPADKWVDAKTFLERQNDNPKMLAERLNKVLEQQDEMVANMERANKLARERETKALEERLKQQHQQQLEALKKERDEAIARYRNDPEAISQISDQFQDRVQNIRPTPVEAVQWAEKHPEFKTNLAFYHTALHEMNQIEQVMPEKAASEHFMELDKRLSARFPEYYSENAGNSEFIEDKRKNNAPPPDSRQMNGVRVAPKKPSTPKLPPPAMKMAQQLLREGVINSIEEYAKDYHGQ